MTIDIHRRNKQLIGKYRSALYDCDISVLENQLLDVFAQDCNIHLAFPFEDLHGPDGLFEGAYKPLLSAINELSASLYGGWRFFRNLPVEIQDQLE